MSTDFKESASHMLFITSSVCFALLDTRTPVSSTSQTAPTGGMEKRTLGTVFYVDPIIDAFCFDEEVLEMCKTSDISEILELFLNSSRSGVWITKFISTLLLITTALVTIKGKKNHFTT
jgi:hypothetical protein